MLREERLILKIDGIEHVSMQMPVDHDRRNHRKAQKKQYMCLGFPYLPYLFALKNAYPNIFMVILA